MKRLLAALATVVAIGIAVWLKTTDNREKIPQTIRDSQATREISSILIEKKATGPVPSEADPPEPAPDPSIPEIPGPVVSKPRRVSLAAVEGAPPQLEGQETGEMPAPVTALENMRTTIRQYGLRFGGNPVGDNAEITDALTGKNPKQVIFLNSDDGIRINGKGQLVDNWDTPYFFHQLSRTEMEIQSAGPDRRMWTADDLVIK